MPLLHRHKSGGNHSARKEVKEHQIAEEELARGNIKQWHKHEAKAHKAGSHVRGASLAPGTEFAGTPIGNYPAGYPMGGPSPAFGAPNVMGMGGPTMGRLPNGQIVSIAPLNGGLNGPGMSGFPNASPQQIGAAMQGGTGFGSGMSGLAPMGGVQPGYGGPDTPAAAMRNMNSGSGYKDYPARGSSMSRRGLWDEEEDLDDYPSTRTRRGRSGSSYLPNSYSDNGMYARGRSSPMGLPSSYSYGADPSYDYPVAYGAQSRHVSAGVTSAYLPMTEEVIIGGPVSNTLTEYSTDMLPPRVIVEGPARGLVSSASSSMGLTPSGTTTTTVLPPVPAGEDFMIAGAMMGSSSFPNSIPSIIEDDGVQMLPPTIVDENGVTVQAGMSEQEIYTTMLQTPAGMETVPPMCAVDSTMGTQNFRQDYQVEVYRGEGSYQERNIRELGELEREVPALVDRMVALRNRLDVHEPTVRRGIMDMPGIPRASSSRLTPDLQQVELAAVRQLQAVDASRVAALEDELLLLRRQVEDPQGVESRAELRRLESRQSQLFARKSEEECEVGRLTAMRQQELARMRQMKRLATMIEEQHEEEQRTLADLQRRSVIEDLRLNDIEEELAFHRTQLRSADAETSTNLRRMDDVSRSLSGEVRLSKSVSQGSRVLTPLIDEPESPTRIARQW